MEGEFEDKAVNPTYTYRFLRPETG